MICCDVCQRRMPALSSLEALSLSCCLPDSIEEACMSCRAALCSVISKAEAKARQYLRNDIEGAIETIRKETQDHEDESSTQTPRS